jgi:hypothetical protein
VVEVGSRRHLCLSRRGSCTTLAVYQLISFPCANLLVGIVYSSVAMGDRPVGVVRPTVCDDGFETVSGLDGAGGTMWART